MDYDQFNKAKASKDGYNTRCRNCVAVYAATFRAKRNGHKLPIKDWNGRKPMSYIYQIGKFKVTLNGIYNKPENTFYIRSEWRADKDLMESIEKSVKEIKYAFENCNEIIKDDLIDFSKSIFIADIPKALTKKSFISVEQYIDFRTPQMLIDVKEKLLTIAELVFE